MSKRTRSPLLGLVLVGVVSLVASLVFEGPVSALGLLLLIVICCVLTALQVNENKYLAARRIVEDVQDDIQEVSSKVTLKIEEIRKGGALEGNWSHSFGSESPELISKQTTEAGATVQALKWVQSELRDLDSKWIFAQAGMRYPDFFPRPIFLRWCHSCLARNRGSDICAAFPTGIPEELKTRLQSDRKPDCHR